MEAIADPGPTEDQITNWNEANDHMERPDYDHPEPARCTAHGKTAEDPTHWCNLNPSSCVHDTDSDSGCAVYAETGMHWDTCANRIVHVLPQTRHDQAHVWTEWAWITADRRKLDPPTGWTPPRGAIVPDITRPDWVDPLVTDACTHGGDCKLHPNAQGLHEFDRLLTSSSLGPSDGDPGDPDDELMYPPASSVHQIIAAAAATTPPPNTDLHDRLAKWWREQAEIEIDMVVAKAIEYGATDLLDIGHQLARTAGRTITDTQAAEWGIAFYALGKLSRIMAAIAEGRDPSLDSWLDLGIYTRMAQRVKETGGWPFHPDEMKRTT